LLALLGAYHVSRIRVKSLTLRLLMSYIYMTLVALGLKFRKTAPLICHGSVRQDTQGHLKNKTTERKLSNYRLGQALRVPGG
jgi:hypothetical protein